MMAESENDARHTQAPCVMSSAGTRETLHRCLDELTGNIMYKPMQDSEQFSIAHNYSIIS